MDEPTLRGVHLERGFGEGATRSYAVRDVSLDVHAGEVALLMGPSGSGKSTLLALMSGLLRPDSGKVLAHDGKELVDIWSLSETQRERFRLKNYGFIFQGYNLFPALTARQQLEIVLRWGMGADARTARRQADHTLSLLGMGHRTNMLPSQLSGGEKQRVAIGRALIKNPRFCFADEPTSALDWAHGETVVELLRSAAHDSGATILMVSHDSRIIPYVDVVYHLEDGVLSGHEPDVAPVGVGLPANGQLRKVP